MKKWNLVSTQYRNHKMFYLRYSPLAFHIILEQRQNLHSLMNDLKEFLAFLGAVLFARAITIHV